MNTRERFYKVIFETDTPAGKNFDIALIVSIIISVIVIVLDSMSQISLAYGEYLTGIEWGLTILFTLEYLLRIWVVERPLRYMTSFFGLIDFMSIVPTYLGLFYEGAHLLIVIRIIRMLRLFRVLKLIRYMNEAQILLTALIGSRRKIIVFLTTVLSIVVIIGTIMYVVEGPENGFVSIPLSMYWAIVTITTVGYGDIAPCTSLGRFFAALLMILGYAIIAVPTGVFSIELNKAAQQSNLRVCNNCESVGHQEGAGYCKDCGSKLT